MNATYIQKIQTVNTGGGCYVDLITMQDGQVIGLNDECIVLYKNMEDFWECSSNNKQTITLNGEMK